jgi:hypothetical protein
MKPAVTRGFVALAVLGALGAADPSGVVVEVEAGRHDRRGTPVILPLPDDLVKARGFVMEGVDDQRPVAVQVVPGDRRAVAWIIDALGAGTSRRYRLKPTDAAPVETGVTCTDDGKGLLLQVGIRPVLRYNHVVLEPPAGIASHFRRSGFIHPLFTPSGVVVSDDFPPDHAHQHGLFFAWVNTTFSGHDLDFWNQARKNANVRHDGILGTAGGPVFGQFTVRLRHEDLTAAGAPAPVLDEVWTVRAYNVSDHYLVDIESRQTCAGDRPLAVNTYHYGGLGLRGNRAWFDPAAKGDNPPAPERSGESDFLTSEGKRRGDGNHTRPRWVDLSGRAGGRFGGVAILDHPDNFRSPQPVRLHPNKPYFCFAPMVPGGFEIAPGRPYVSRYRLDLHDDRPDPPSIERSWHDYAEPPVARVVEGR